MYNLGVSSPANVVESRGLMVLPTADPLLDLTTSTESISGANKPDYPLITNGSLFPSPPTTIHNASPFPTNLNSAVPNNTFKSQANDAESIASFFTPHSQNPISNAVQNPQSPQSARDITVSPPPLSDIPPPAQANVSDPSFAIFERERSRSRSVSSLSSLTELSVRSSSVGPRNTVAATATHTPQDSGTAKRSKKRQRPDAGQVSTSARSHKKRRRRSHKFPLRVSSTVTSGRSTGPLDDTRSTYPSNANQCKWPDKLSTAGVHREVSAALLSSHIALIRNLRSLYNVIGVTTGIT